MQYFKIDTGKFIEFNEATNAVRVVVKSEVEKQLEDITAQVGEQTLLTDKQLLAWAKENYPISTDYKQLEAQKAEETKLKELLTNLDG